MTDTNLLQNTQDEMPNLDLFRDQVAECAYHKAEKRNFAAGYETEDWLKAEQEVSNQYHLETQEA